MLQAQAMSEGGDIFVLDMGEPVKIVDLAQRMIVLSGVPTHLEFTGLRPGEKMHEILVHGDSGMMDTRLPGSQTPHLFASDRGELLGRGVRAARAGTPRR